MNTQLPPSLSRLASVNPSVVDDDLGRSPEAQAQLARILATKPVPAPRRSRRWAPRRLLLVAVTAMVLASSGAVAATDPFGWWQSPNPNTAQYRADTTTAVRTPTIVDVRCGTGANGFQCGAGLHGRPYTLIDRISSPSRDVFARASIRRLLATAFAAGRISGQFQQRVLGDLAAVPDSFLTQLNQSLVYGTYGGGSDKYRQLVPPPGVPAFLACQSDGALLACQNLNGDTSTPIGSGVYMAMETADWRPAPPRRPDAQLPVLQHMTPAELQLLTDLVVRGSTTTTTSTSSASGTSTSSG